MLFHLYVTDFQSNLFYVISKLSMQPRVLVSLDPYFITPQVIPCISSIDGFTKLLSCYKFLLDSSLYLLSQSSVFFKLTELGTVIRSDLDR